MQENIRNFILFLGFLFLSIMKMKFETLKKRKAISLSFLLIMTSISTFLLVRELYNQNLSVKQESDELSQNLGIQLQNALIKRINLIEIFKTHWESKSMNASEEEAFFYDLAPFYHSQYPGIKAISWLSPQGVITYRYPILENDPAVNKSVVISADGTLNSALNSANQTHTITISNPKTLYINEENRQGYVVYYPLLINGTLTGFLNLVFQSEIVVQQIVNKILTINNFQYCIFDEETRVFCSENHEINENPDDFLSSQNFSFLDRQWEIYLTPKQDFLLKSYFSNNLTLFLLVLAILVASILFHSSTNNFTKNLMQSYEEKEKIAFELEQVKKMDALGNLAGGIAHDFNNLLTVINGCSELLLSEDDYDNTKYISDLVKEIYKAGQNASSLTTQLLSFSRKQVVDHKQIDINELIQNTYNMLHRIIGEQIEIYCHLTCDLGEIKIDPNQMKQILINLVINARDAIRISENRSDGKISLSTSKKFIATRDSIEGYKVLLDNFNPGQYIQLSIQDNGIGMDEEIQNHLFEPFFSTKNVGEGTGLGLSTIYGIVKHINGFISIITTKGKGSKFQVYFPQQALVKSSLSEKKSFPSTNLEGTANILLIEDEIAVRKYLDRLLTNYGYHILFAPNGIEGFQIFQQKYQEIDLVISDVIMPKTDIQHMIIEMQKINPHLRIILISGYLSKDIDLEFLSDYELIQKPFKKKDLLQRIKYHLNSSPISSKNTQS